jgi:hypothetical protein
MTNVALAPIFQSIFSLFPRVPVKPRHLVSNHQTRERRCCRRSRRRSRLSVVTGAGEWGIDLSVSTSSG